MNKTQLKVLWVGIGMFVLMGLFPPNSQKSLRPRPTIAYSFILETRDVAFTHLFIQWAIVAVVTAALVYTLNVRNKSQRSDSRPQDPDG